MLAALARPISFPDIGISEQDQDPNTALMELDRGLKSSNVGEQCEAISRFPGLFEKYPFPILLNSAMLKLAEVFRQETAGSNFVRVCVCEVLEASARHLDKLINVEEFLRRITTVMHSNDPLARALTLRALGLLCDVVGEGRQVQHLVRGALDASHPLELEAAIAASEKYAAVSKTFAVSMCERLTLMLSALSTPVEVKLQLIKVFQHMHHDAETAATVRGVCLQLLERYPTQRVVITTLRALTQLAAHCLVHIPLQVDLVLQWVGGECRAGVRSAGLQQLRVLASAAPHAWTPSNVAALVAFTRATRVGGGGVTVAGSVAVSASVDGGVNTSANAANVTKLTSAEHKTTAAALEVLATLTSAQALPHLNLTPDGELVQLSREFVYDTNIDIATTAQQLYTNVALYIHDDCGSEDNPGLTSEPSSIPAGSCESTSSAVLCGDALNAGVSLLQTLAQQAHNSTHQTTDNSPSLATTAFTHPPPHQSFKIPLVCCVLLARCEENLAVSLTATLVTMLTDDSLPRSSTGGSCSVVVCEALASLGGSRRGVLTPHIAPLLGLLHSITKDTPKDKGNMKLINVVCSVVLEAYLGHSWDDLGMESVMLAARHAGHWTAYRIARQAARYGHHQVAASIYSGLRSKVCSDQQHYWLTALTQVSTGEAWTVLPSGDGGGGGVVAAAEASEQVSTDVVDDRAKPLTAAATCLYNALANFKACSTGQYPLSFAQQYTSLRASALTNHAQLATTCQSMRTSPPPAIAASQVAALRDEMVRCCRLVQQLNKLAKDFTDLAGHYATLYQSQFDADPQTLSNIRMQQEGAKVMAKAISVLTRPMPTDHHHHHHLHHQQSVSSGAVEEVTAPATTSATVQEQLMRRALDRAATATVELEQLCLEKKSIMECQLQQVMIISELVLGALPLPYPRLFYQSLQHTTITLNITPQPRTPGDPITLQNSSQLAVKVEGVIGHGRHPGLFRSVKTVTLLVNSTLQNRPSPPPPPPAPHVLDSKVETTESLTQTVEPHNDFFSAQFLLAFPIPGQYQVTVDASVSDQNDETWQTGPRHSLAVKALEDPTNAKPLPGPQQIPPVRPPQQQPLPQQQPPATHSILQQQQLPPNMQPSSPQQPPPMPQTSMMQQQQPVMQSSSMQYQPPPPNMQSMQPQALGMQGGTASVPHQMQPMPMQYQPPSPNVNFGGGFQ